MHLMFGLAGSGKSTLARELTSGGSGVRFTLDEWMIRLEPEVSIDSAEYGPKADRARDLIWSVAQQVLATGADVVLDWNSWSVERRAWAAQRAHAVGAVVIVHKLSTSIAEARVCPRFG
ncbi:hypothetical protein AZH51_17575 [Branchiibius sp. NY16-3462-2]|nr:hypothetical protein AZH51_17575 [Branchiibius sp. NY16-3462-2]